MPDTRRAEHLPRPRTVLRQLGLALILGLLVGGTRVPPAVAHGMSAGDKPLVSGLVSLKHLRAGEVISLFAREHAPANSARLPRAARAGTDESLLPNGVDALLPAAGTDAVTLVGNEGFFPRLLDCLRVLDVPVESKASGRQRVVLNLRGADGRAIRTAVLRLPGRGSATLTGHQLVLEGTTEWLHRSLRQVIRGEMEERTTLHPPTL